MIQSNIKCSHSRIVKLGELKAHPKNRNKHSDKQIEVLAKIIAKTGQRSPIVVSNQSNYIVKGHGRFAAIQLLGWDECAVDFQDYKNELEELEDRIADNEIARYAEFQQEEALEDLKELGLDLDEFDFEEIGLLDFEYDLLDEIDFSDEPDESKEEEKNKKYVLQVQLPNQLELDDLYDDLLAKGYLVKK